MGVLQSLISAKMANNQELVGLADAYNKRNQVEKLKALGREFLSGGDYSYDALRQFAAKKQVDPQTFTVLKEMISGFQKKYPDIGATREIKVGEDIETQAHTGKGEYKTIATSPRWKPEGNPDWQKKIAFIEKNPGVAKKYPSVLGIDEKEDPDWKQKIDYIQSNPDMAEKYPDIFGIKTKDNPQWMEKLDFAEGHPDIAEKYPTVFGIKQDKETDLEEKVRFAKENPELAKQLGIIGEDKETALEEKISTIKEAYKGISDDQAKRIALGTLKVVTDPVSGNFELVDVGTEEQIPLKTRGEKPLETRNRAKREIDLYEATEKGTGLYSAILNALSVGSSMVGGPIAEDTVKARQKLIMAQRSLYRALRESSRVLAFEMKTIFEEHPIDPSMVRSPKMAKANMEVIDQVVRNRIANAQNAANDRSLPTEDRKNARSTIQAMKNFLDILNVPKSDTKEQVTGIPSIKGVEEYRNLPVGTKYKDPEGNIRIKR